jgi:hypothetical protein
MGTATQHSQRAEYHGEFLASIDGARFWEWGAIVAFYKAVHLAEKLFTLTGHHCTGHKARNARLRAKYPKVWVHYQPLWNYAVLARYDCHIRVSKNTFQNEVMAKLLPAIEREVALYFPGS